jgi:ATP-dependent DNA helicase PIF1
LYVALSRATAKSNIKILALPPNAEEYNSKKKDKKKPSVKEKIKTSDSKNKKTVTRNGTYTKNIVYKEVLTL